MTHAETWKIAAEPFGRAILAFAGTVVGRLRKIAATFKHRRDLSALAGLDDRMLADIGLTRSDLREAFSEPLWRDPTSLLVNRVRGRRRSEYRWVTGAVTAPPLVPLIGGAAARITR